MRTIVMALLGLGAMATLVRADDPSPTCESCPATGRCTWVTETKKTKEVVYSTKRSEYCPSTIAANCPGWASFLRTLGCDPGSPRTKHQLVKKYEEKEIPVKKLKVAAPCEP